MKSQNYGFLAGALMLLSAPLLAQNPIIRDNFTADPSAHVFNGRVYLYPSHDIPAPYDYNRKDWFCMADYHVYSSDNLVDWVDHGVIVDQTYVPWVNTRSYSMWAPDCNVKDGKYYFYFPANNRIGLATADQPYGPFRVEEQPIQGANGIDPCIFIDDDGTPYLIWSGMGMRIAKLKDNMKEFDGESTTIQHNTPQSGMKEGPFMFKRNGIYYFTFPWAEKERETLAYCMGKSPMGPFEYKGKIMEQSETVCWTNHHSVVEFQGKWYLFYHHNDYSPYFDKNRSVCIDELTFNEDGTINLVKPTLRGVGVTPATREIQIDRYSSVGPENVKIDFVNSDRTFDGWKAIFWNTTEYRQPIYLTYDRVDFGDKPLKSVTLKCHSLAGGVIDLRADNAQGQLLASVTVPGKPDWTEVVCPLQASANGVHTLYVSMRSGNHIEIDWVRFNP